MLKGNRDMVTLVLFATVLLAYGLSWWLFAMMSAELRMVEDRADDFAHELAISKQLYNELKARQDDIDQRVGDMLMMMEDDGK